MRAITSQFMRCQNCLSFLSLCWLESGDKLYFDGVMEMMCMTVVHVCRQALLLVRMAASIAPMLVTGPPLSHPPVLMMASVVR